MEYFIGINSHFQIEFLVCMMKKRKFIKNALWFKHLFRKNTMQGFMSIQILHFASLLSLQFCQWVCGCSPNPLLFSVINLGLLISGSRLNFAFLFLPRDDVTATPVSEALWHCHKIQKLCPQHLLINRVMKLGRQSFSKLVIAFTIDNCLSDLSRCFLNSW